MDAKSQALLDATLELPEPDRARIAEALLATLSPGADVPEDEYADELERRLGEALDDPSATVAWDALRDEK
jgi:putative addiction module component (TIGR02574 family)